MNRKFTAILLSLIFSVATVSAADFDVRKFGAVGDGVRKDTEAIQKAIDVCTEAGGGRVVLSGGVYLSAPLELRSGVDLHIEADATLLASPDIEDYPDRTDVRHYLSEAMPRFRNASFLFADEAENIAISGRGKIDVNGQYHIRRIPDEAYRGGRWYERIYPLRKTLPRVVFLAGCKFVSVTDISLVNQPAAWGFWIHDCDYVTFDRCKIISDLRFPNNDGIHINCSRDVSVSNCFIEAGDDALVVRANSRSLRENKPCERVVVTNCTLKSWAYGIRVGWTNDGVMRNCVFSNLVISNSWRGIGMDFPEPHNRNDWGREPSLVEHIIFSNIIMDNLYSRPISISVSTSEKLLFEGVRDIHFTNVHARSLEGLVLRGLEDKPLEDLVFTNCSFKQIKPDDVVVPKDMKAVFTNGVSTAHLKGLVMRDTLIEDADGKSIIIKSE